MKKILLVAIALFTVNAINAQTGFGAKVGLNIANVSGDDIDDSDSRLGAYVGLTYEYAFNEQFSIQPELVYSMQGAKYEESNEAYSYEGKTKLDYINIPVLVKYYPAEQFFIVAGPQFGFNVSAKYDYEETVAGVTAEEDGDLDDIESFDLSLALGLGYKFMNNLGVEARYNFGMTDLVEEADAKNSVAQIGVFYTFN